MENEVPRKVIGVDFKNRSWLSTEEEKIKREEMIKSVPSFYVPVLKLILEDIKEKLSKGERNTDSLGKDYFFEGVEKNIVGLQELNIEKDHPILNILGRLKKENNPRLIDFEINIKLAIKEISEKYFEYCT